MSGFPLDTEASLIGTLVGTYRVEDKIGEGGMGCVYLAVHPVIGKRVAIKVLHGYLATDREIVSRFFTEARAVTRVGHRNIVDVLDSGVTDGGICYMTMELLEGESLASLIERERRLPLVRSVNIGLQVADALDASHKAGIVHRDLKPENVHLGPGTDGADLVKVLDFGIAKLMGDRERSNVGHRTRSGVVIGTPAYMSPEQCAGQVDIDSRTDIYALGTILFHMLAGRCPFEEENVGRMLLMQMTQRVPKLRELRPELPAAVEAAVDRALQKNRDARFQTAGEFAQALRVAAGIKEENLGSGLTGVNEAVPWKTGRFAAEDVNDRIVGLPVPKKRTPVPAAPSSSPAPAAPSVAAPASVHAPGAQEVARLPLLTPMSAPPDLSAHLNDDDFETFRVDADKVPPEIEALRREARAERAAAQAAQAAAAAAGARAAAGEAAAAAAEDAADAARVEAAAVADAVAEANAEEEDDAEADDGATVEGVARAPAGAAAALPVEPPSDPSLIVGVPAPDPAEPPSDPGLGDLGSDGAGESTDMPGAKTAVVAMTDLEGAPLHAADPPTLPFGGSVEEFMSAERTAVVANPLAEEEAPAEAAPAPGARLERARAPLPDQPTLLIAQPPLRPSDTTDDLGHDEVPGAGRGGGATAPFIAAPTQLLHAAQRNDLPTQRLEALEVRPTATARADETGRVMLPSRTAPMSSGRRGNRAALLWILSILFGMGVGVGAYFLVVHRGASGTSAADDDDPPAAGEVRIALDSKPRGAKVLLGEDVVGTTPTHVNLPADGHVVEFVFAKSGYESRTRRIRVVASREVRVELVGLTDADEPSTAAGTPAEHSATAAGAGAPGSAHAHSAMPTAAPGHSAAADGTAATGKKKPGTSKHPGTKPRKGGK